MLSIARVVAHPWLKAETIAGNATASATVRNSTGFPPFQIAARAATVLGPHSMPLHHLSEVAHREDAEDVGLHGPEDEAKGHDGQGAKEREHGAQGHGHHLLRSEERRVGKESTDVWTQ